MRFTNLEQPNIQKISLTNLIDNSLSHFSNLFKEELTYKIEIDKEYESILGDPYQLEMAFQILIENSIEAMKGNGNILISSTLAQSLGNSYKDFIEIEFADSGPGIPLENIDKIFEPYFTTKSEGTGMGLAIAQKIVNDHGGEINIESRLDFATVFRISLPYGNMEN